MFSSVPNAPMGTWQPPPSSASMARSAVTGRRVHGSSSGAQASKPALVFERLDRQRALPHRRAHDVGAEDFADDVAPAEPPQTRGRQHDGVVLALLHFVDARIDIAADRLHIQIAAGAACSCAMRRSELVPTDRAEFQIAQLAADDGVARIGALRNGGDGQAFRQFGGQIFHAVNGEIDAPVEQRFFDFLREQTLAADFVQRDIE